MNLLYPDRNTGRKEEMTGRVQSAKNIYKAVKV